MFQLTSFQQNNIYYLDASIFFFFFFCFSFGRALIPKRAGSVNTRGGGQNTTHTFVCLKIAPECFNICFFFLLKCRKCFSRVPGELIIFFQNKYCISLTLTWLCSPVLIRMLTPYLFSPIQVSRLFGNLNRWDPSSTTLGICGHHMTNEFLL